MVEMIHDLEEKYDVSSVIFRSAVPKIFSAGFDVQALYNPKASDVLHLYRSFQNLYIALYGTPLNCIAAIEGKAIGGGCMIAMCCDFRIMSESDEHHRYSIGLNESLYGVAPPPWLAQLLFDTVGLRQADLIMQLGVMYTAEQAHDVNLVDRLTPYDEVYEVAKQQALYYAETPSHSRVACKMYLRKPRIDQLRATQEEDAENFVQLIMSDQVQESISAFLKANAEILRKKKNKRKTSKAFLAEQEKSEKELQQLDEEELAELRDVAEEFSEFKDD
jgi:3,2-trans-enoyl-CoA isomerase